MDLILYLANVICLWKISTPCPLKIRYWEMGELCGPNGIEHE